MHYLTGMLKEKKDIDLMLSYDEFPHLKDECIQRLSINTAEVTGLRSGLTLLEAELGEISKANAGDPFVALFTPFFDKAKTTLTKLEELLNEAKQQFTYITTWLGEDETSGVDVMTTIKTFCKMFQDAHNANLKRKAQQEKAIKEALAKASKAQAKRTNMKADTSTATVKSASDLVSDIHLEKRKKLFEARKLLAQKGKQQSISEITQSEGESTEKTSEKSEPASTEST